MLLALIKTLRPKQWVKNSFVAAPLFFSLRLLDPQSVLRTAAAVGLFSLISGCVYVLNDLVDVEADREHPKKRLRPIASGALPMAAAKGFLAVAVPLCVTLAFVLQPWFCAVLSSYFVLNVGYSFRFKHVAYLDVLLIALFFILRVLAGAFAIEVVASPWLLGCTFLLALFLGFGKRAHELATAVDAGKQRAALAGYHPQSLRWILYVLSAAVVLTYAAYTLSPHTVEQFGTASLIYTVPLPAVAIVRFIRLATTRKDAESPTDAMLRDPLFMAAILGYVVETGAILYWG
ncbi:decaprenyl-phosphate phosphoribosyltransferase [Paraliomyxa miuraensis]|uniref:decaprenyl-phosphate phosphoribosyltransferase n=1 Tax=Paraliomyxa miuraensis TaxID=376150 RepID=UPI00225BDC5F|nr:decaprenyl-phosphate phosphoribosyltransferase [Paraliomyxa miuraensis]MCX4244489.1 decaprenyl-phosphate phosphoribosyltransferase [Paraliomyxa miuraensis]